MRVIIIGTCEEIKAKIMELEKEFKALKDKAIKLLEDSRTTVKKVAYELTAQPMSELDKDIKFLEEKSEELRNQEDHMALFGCLNLYWNYLSPHLLKHLVHELPPLQCMKEMERYTNHLRDFRMQTPLKLFCEIEKKNIKQPEDFVKVVTKFEEVKKKQSERGMTLQDLENFRQKYGNCYKLCDFVFMLQEHIEDNSFTVTFIVAKAVVGLLQSYFPEELHKILRQFNVTHLCIHDQSIPIQQMISMETDETVHLIETTLMSAGTLKTTLHLYNQPILLLSKY